MTAALPREFALIGRHFRPLAAPAGLELGDDAAVLAPPGGRELVIAADAMIAGVHFPPDENPARIGQKLLRVNLSDLAAMGAAPLGYLITLAAPHDTSDAWFAGFAAGLAEDQARYGIGLLGGDTTATPGPLCLSLTILGHVAPGCAIRRRGASPGDGVWVTGTIGDGALGLAVLQGRLADASGRLVDRYRLPQPRLGLALAGIAAAGMDVSDGLVQDLGHLCRAGGLGAEIETEAVPLSPAAQAAGPDWLSACLTGGDDYELLLALPADREPALLAEAARAGVPVTRIGRFVAGSPVVAVRDAAGRAMAFGRGGWSHF
ncbi:MAG: thiamine-phosphate kinase [Acidisphaera sp.]|nr:thiamine-phosphate kinase [Acidisphaera sp.]